MAKFKFDTDRDIDRWYARKERQADKAYGRWFRECEEHPEWTEAQKIEAYNRNLDMVTGRKIPIPVQAAPTAPTTTP